MSTRRQFIEEFKLEAVKQVVERGFGVRDVAAWLGTSPHSLYAWVNKYGIPAEQRLVGDDQTAKLKRLEAELRRGYRRARHPKKRLPHTLPRSPVKVRFHQKAPA
jgi:transposase